MFVIGGKRTERNIELEPNTVLLDKHMIGWFDLMYSTLTLESGKSFNVPAFTPWGCGDLLKMAVTIAVTINVRQEQANIEVGGKNYRVFVCDVPAFNETDYVTGDGTLLKVEIPALKMTIELVD